MGPKEKTKCSFIDESKLRKPSRVELEAMISNPEKILSDLDLTDVDCSELVFDGCTLHNVVFSRYSNENNNKKVIFQSSFRAAKLTNVSFQQSKLIRCNFDSLPAPKDKTNQNSPVPKDKSNQNSKSSKIVPTEMEKVDFFFSELQYCRFRDVIGNIIDYRYSKIGDCSMSKCKITMGDFYMAEFYGATSFSESIFQHCSITSSVFRGNCLTMDNLKSEKYRNVGLVQDKYKLYNKFSKIEDWCKANPCGATSHLNDGEENNDALESMCYIANESRQCYSELSGMYAGRGLNRDANRAYRMSKRKELEYYWLSFKLLLRDKKLIRAVGQLFRCFPPFLVKLMGYGYRGGIILLWFIALVFGFAIYHYSIVNNTFSDSLQTSLNNSMGPYESFISTVHGFSVSLEPTIGVLLIGFLGFVIANKIRNNS